MWSKILVGIGLACTAAVTIIATGGIAVPMWVIPVLTATGAGAAHMAQSPIRDFHDAIETAKLAGEAAKASSDATEKK